MVSRRQQEKAMERARSTDKQEEVKPEPTPEQKQVIKIVDALRQGEKKSTVTVLKHQIVMKVLNAREEMQVMTLVSEYEGKFAYPLAFNVATFAMSVQSIDGERFIDSISSLDDTPESRYDKARKFYSKFVEAYIVEYMKMKDEADAELESLKK